MLSELFTSLFEIQDEDKYANQFREDSSGKRRTQMRDNGFFSTFRHIQRIPGILLDLEVYFALTCFGLAEHLLGLLLLPVKVILLTAKGILHRRDYVSTRDRLSLGVMSVCLLVYWLCSSATTQLYSYMYHAVRRTSFIKLVMIFSILDVLDKALSSLTQDTLEVFYAALESRHHRPSKCYRSSTGHRKTESPLKPPPTPGNSPAPQEGSKESPAASASSMDEPMRFASPAEGEKTSLGSSASSERLCGPPPPVTVEASPSHDEQKPLVFSTALLVGAGVTATLTVALHSLSLLLVAVTLNVSINADANSLLALLISNNFTELKSTIFKKYTPESLHSVCVVDAIERLQYILLFFVITVQHISEKFNELAVIDGIIIISVEVVIDFAKLLFCCKFNGIPLSVFRSYTELSLLDIAAEKVLWKLSAVDVRVVPPLEPIPLTASPPVGKRDPTSAELLQPNYGFSPKNVKRAGLDANAYAALVLWSLLRVAGYLCQSAPMVLLLCFTALCLMKLLLSAVVSGVAARFVLRSLLEDQPRVPTARHTGPRTSKALRQRLTSALLRDETEPAPCRDSNDGEPENAPTSAFVVQLTPLLCALLRADRFDLQAGKKKQ